VATRLLTHTQVLSDETAILTEATPGAVAQGVLLALGNPDRAVQIGQRARHLADTKYSYAAYLENTRQAVQALSVPPVDAPVRGAAGPNDVKDLA
jgi:hypothetical protein